MRYQFTGVINYPRKRLKSYSNEPNASAVVAREVEAISTDAAVAMTTNA